MLYKAKNWHVLPHEQYFSWTTCLQLFEFLENFGADSGIVCVLKVVPYNFIFKVVKTGWVGSVEIWSRTNSLW